MAISFTLRPATPPAPLATPKGTSRPTFICRPSSLADPVHGAAIAKVTSVSVTPWTAAAWAALAPTRAPTTSDVQRHMHASVEWGDPSSVVGRLKLPLPLRFCLARDARLLSEVLGLFLRPLFALQRRTARRLGVPRPRTGAVAFVPRFCSALQLTPHFHLLLPEAVFE